MVKPIELAIRINSNNKQISCSPRKKKMSRATEENFENFKKLIIEKWRFE